MYIYELKFIFLLFWEIYECDICYKVLFLDDLVKNSVGF